MRRLINLIDYLVLPLKTMRLCLFVFVRADGTPLSEVERSGAKRNDCVEYRHWHVGQTDNQAGRQAGKQANGHAGYKLQQHGCRLTVMRLVPPIEKRKGRAGRSAPFSVPRALEIQFRHCDSALLPDRSSLVRSFVRSLARFLLLSPPSVIERSIYTARAAREDFRRGDITAFSSDFARKIWHDAKSWKIETNMIK